jgi:FkbM family methyltransferase
MSIDVPIKTAAKSIFTAASKVISFQIRERLLRVGLRSFSEREKLRLGLPTVEGLLQAMRANEFVAKTVIDIGANVGRWSEAAASVFPSARFVLIDGNPKNYSHLKAVASKLGSNSEFTIALLGAEEKNAVPFYDLGTGSSILPELTSFEKSGISLPMLTLDGLFATRVCEVPLLLKLDVQGYELEVLRGGRKVLTSAEVVILETSLLPYNEGAPLMADVISFMAREGFVPFDFCGQLRRESDYALFQTDVAFARTSSALRAPRKFWLAEP